MAGNSVAVNASGLLAAARAQIAAQAKKLQTQTVIAAAQATAARWAEAVRRTNLSSAEQQAYIASIKWTMTGPNTATVSASYKEAAEIESGRPARNLEQMLDTSPKVRRTKDGRRYLIIPFRDGQGATAPAGGRPVKTPSHHLSHTAKLRAPAGRGSPTALTFRVMMEGSTGWIAPAQPGKDVAKTVEGEMRNYKAVTPWNGSRA